MKTPSLLRGRFAFTLIELLVVIAVIAIMASLLLPGLALAKSEGQSAKCKSNLRQLGLSLFLYTQDYQKYPQVVPVKGKFWDTLLLPYAASNTFLFVCPANRSSAAWTIYPTESLPNPSYGYNYVGTGRYQPTMSGLGLDGGPAPLRENQVKVPSDMVAMSDCTNNLTGGGDHDQDDWINLLSQLSPPRHNKGDNAVFCDNHVEYEKWKTWTAATDVARQRWNNDHMPHRETWSRDP